MDKEEKVIKICIVGMIIFGGIALICYIIVVVLTLLGH